MYRGLEYSLAYDFTKEQIVSECKCDAHYQLGGQGKVLPCQVGRTVRVKKTEGRPIGELVAWIRMPPPGNRRDHVFAPKPVLHDRVAARAWFETLPGGAAWAELYEARGAGEPL
jgi:hypothetical protein